MKIKRILFSPVHFFFYGRSGSELSWSYNIFNKISKKLDCTAICFYSLEGEDKNVLPCSNKKINATYFYSDWEAFKFTILYTIFGVREIKKNKINIIHHLLPFYIEKTFNPLFFIFKNRKKIIGPIQVPLNYNAQNKNISLNPLNVILRYLSINTLRQASVIIAVNEASKRMLIEKDLPKEKIIIIPPGIDTKEFKVERTQKRKINKVQLITVSHLIHRKRVDLILKALLILIRQNITNIHLTIVGDGPQRKILEQMVINGNLKDYVTFLGYVPNKEIHKFYAKADIFVSMSESESWGQMYLEAMTTGLPIISAKNIGSESIIKSTKLGFLINKNDHKSLADKIHTLIQDKKLLLSMNKNVKSEITNNYDWDNAILPKYIKLYDSILTK